MDFATVVSIVSVAFLSSFSHCIGMCGGFLGLQAFFLKDKTQKQTLFFTTLYHLARIFAYVLIGAVFGAFGGIFVISGTSRAFLFFMIGFFLVFIGVALWVRGDLLKFIENDKISKFVTKNAFKLSKKHGILNFVALGFLNGLLPCGVVYYFAAMAIASSSVVNGALIMLLFGLSTLPVMVGFVTFFNLINETFKQIMFKISLIIVILNGIYLTFLGYMANNG
ncbi:sulfite exporter TauE/SafE family protein [Campylobacter sp. RM13119]|uniref:sulfite exporter TauE/SafE family protein n=1 Tax=Campylobacter TaxID=194 RepID=UPI001474A67E|nr:MULTISPECIES: sulfite exporter TauE/SafE family protein [unclassified Campylobacter]MBE3606420.1 sulfite exporter TauE/SafE family protein [Campylobacter sp. RM13119]MBE3609553.1 sulfite exporter TauE/SafE family protein [Campylobacter sp. RM12916]